MQVSAEVRWFWDVLNVPPNLDAWFVSGMGHFPPGGGDEERSDEYVLDVRQAELGIKGSSAESVGGISRRRPGTRVFRGSDLTVDSA